MTSFFLAHVPKTSCYSVDPTLHILEGKISESLVGVSAGKEIAVSLEYDSKTESVDPGADTLKEATVKIAEEVVVPVESVDRLSVTKAELVDTSYKSDAGGAKSNTCGKEVVAKVHEETTNNAMGVRLDVKTNGTSTAFTSKFGAETTTGANNDL